MKSIVRAARPPSGHRGFTLVELMIALAVLAILVAVATPSFREMSLNNRSTTVINSLLADLALARNEAVKAGRNAHVTARSGVWNQGWELWIDANGNGSRDGADEPVLKEYDAINGSHGADNSFTLRAVGGVSGAAADEIVFGAMGQTRQPDDGARVTLCRPDGDPDRSTGIRIDLSGRAQSVRNLSGLGLGCS